MSIYEKLLGVQAELKAPKGQTNTFGKYKYRSCEDILEALKPVLVKHKATVFIADELVSQESGFNYIKAVVTFADVETGETISNAAYARESKEKKGMDDSQITGTASSYARKYALNGMFCIDDTKDADTDEYRNQTKTVKDVVEENKAKNDNADKLVTKAQLTSLNKLMQEKGFKLSDCDRLKAAMGIEKLDSMTSVQYDAFLAKVENHGVESKAS